MAEILIATIMRPTGDTGVQTHFQTFRAWLDTQGRSVNIVTPYSYHLWLVYPVFALRKLIDILSGPASVWWYRYWHQLFLMLALRKVLWDGKACSIYAQCPLSADAAMRARRNLSQKVMLVVHFNLSQADEWAGKGKIAMQGNYASSIRRFEQHLLTRLDGLIFVSEFMYEALLKRIPRIVDVPYAVIPNFVPDPFLGQNIGHAYTPSEQQTDLLIIGTLEPRKNQSYALEIVAAAKSKGHLLKLTVAGDGPDADMLKQLAETLGISQQVKFLGFVRNAAKLFPQHRACLHTARIENLPITLVEALAYGVPVFATHVGGIPEVISEGQEGRFIPLDQPEVAANILITWLVEQPEAMQHARQHARETFLHRFESHVAAARLTQFLTGNQD